MCFNLWTPVCTLNLHHFFGGLCRKTIASETVSTTFVRVLGDALGHPWSPNDHHPTKTQGSPGVVGGHANFQPTCASPNRWGPIGRPILERWR